MNLYYLLMLNSQLGLQKPNHMNSYEIINLLNIYVLPCNKVGIFGESGISGLSRIALDQKSSVMKLKIAQADGSLTLAIISLFIVHS